jgi:hypothetical protein
MNAEPELFEYGILTEASDIRAHVGVAGRAVYIFQTKVAVQLLTANLGKYPIKPAEQPDVDGITATGWCVPFGDIPDIRRVRYHSYPWQNFSPKDKPSEKGRKAVEVVTALLRIGKFPIWIDATESPDVVLQITGTDVIIFNKTRIQVKCDWRCGNERPWPECTGNLFLQKSERNPLKRI